MQTKMIALLGLVAATSLAACVDPQVRPAPEVVQTPTKQTQSTPPQPAGNTAPSASLEEVRDKVMVLLSGIEHIPTKEEFQRAGTEDQVVGVLDGIARDNGSKLRFRANAAAALGNFPRPDTRKTLEALITEEGLNEVIRRPSVKAYGFAFGAEAVPLLSKVLEFKDRNTREAALRALADVKTPAARQAIEVHSKIETDDALRKLAQETLAR